MANLESNLIKRLDDLSINIIRVHVEASLTKEPMTYAPAHEHDMVDQEQTSLAKSLNLATRIHPIGSALCSCNCHAQLAVRTPQWLGSTFGSLLISYSRPSPESCRACSRKSCSDNTESSFRSRYYFPPWMLHRMFSFRCIWNPLSGCNISLKTPRAVSSRSMVFTLAQHGNIRGMQRLFEQREASPYDISIEEGRSALHVRRLASFTLMTS